MWTTMAFGLLSPDFAELMRSIKKIWNPYLAIKISRFDAKHKKLKNEVRKLNHEYMIK